MWVQNATREDLLNIIQSERLPNQTLQQLDTFQELLESSSELIFVWKEDPREWGKLPSIIILGTMTTKDFFAWTGTYLQQCNPLTALCRVIEREKLLIALDSHVRFELGKLETICIGMIIGEAATYLAGQSELNRLNMNAFAGTYSFTMSRAIASNICLASKSYVGELWLEARRLTGQQLLKLSREDIDQVWRIIFNIFGYEGEEKRNQENKIDVIISACDQIIQYGDFDEQIWKGLTEGLFSKKVVREIFKGPREERVEEVERLLKDLCQLSNADKLLSSFIGGYLVSRIAPGEFEHYNVIIPYLNRLPNLLLWYGLCAGLPSNSKLRNFGVGTGRRILRDIVQEDSIFNRPRCDIAIGELKVLNEGNHTRGFPSRESGYFIIELLPCLNATMRKIENRQIDSIRSLQEQQTLLPHAKELELKKLLLELDNSIKSVGRIREQIEESVGLNRQHKAKHGTIKEKTTRKRNNDKLNF